MVAFVPANALGQVLVEVLALPLATFSSKPNGALGSPTAGLAVEVGVALPGGSAFGYGLRLHAATAGPGLGEVSALGEVRVTTGLPRLGDRWIPVVRGGLRIGRVSEDSDERLLIGPHLYLGLSFFVGDGATLDFFVGGRGSFLPFEAGIGAGVALSAPAW